MLCVYNFRTLSFIILISLTDTAAGRGYWGELEEFRNNSEFSKAVVKRSKKLLLQTKNMTIIFLNSSSNGVENIILTIYTLQSLQWPYSSNGVENIILTIYTLQSLPWTQVHNCNRLLTSLYKFEQFLNKIFLVMGSKILLNKD
jgi:hypothetical protein